MSFKKAIIQNTSLRIIGIFFLFISNILTARLLGVEQSGHFFYAITCLTFFITLFRLGIENGIVFLTSKSPNATGTLFYLIVPIIAFQTAIIFLILRYLNFYKPIINIELAVLFISSNIYLYYLTAFFHGKKEFNKINVINTIANIFQAIILGYFFFVKNNIATHNILSLSTNNVFLVFTLAITLQVIYLIIYFRYSYKSYFLNLKFSPFLFKGLFLYSGLNFAITLVGFLIMRIDLYFVEKYCNPYELGNYVQAAKIGQMAFILPGLLGGVIFPFAINASEKFIEKIAFLCRTILVVFIMAFILTLIFGHFGFPWLLGKKFDLVFPVILLMLPGIYCMSISLLLLSYLEGKNKQMIILLSNIFILFIITLADFYFVPIYKFWGAAIVFSIANFIGLFVLLNYFIKNTSLKVNSIFKFNLLDIKKIILLIKEP